MIPLDDDQKKALTEWIVYALSKLKCDSKQVELLNKYIHTLIKMDSPTDKIKNSLREFIDDKTDSFVDELQDRLNKKDFSFQKEQPPPPPKQAEPPHPKQQEPTPKPQTQPHPKQNISENKKEIKPSSNVANTKITKKSEVTSSTSKIEKESQIKTHDQNRTQQPQQQKPPHDQTKPAQKNHQPLLNPQQFHRQQPQQKSSHINALFEDDLINAENDEEPQSDETVEKVSEEKIDTKNTEPASHYIIFIAGIDHNNYSISILFNLFTKYGRILAIEVNEEEKVAYIEFEELLSAFKAVKAHNKKNLFKNAYIQVDYAIQPDPEKLADLESEYTKRKQLRQEKKQQMLQQQKKESESNLTNQDEEILEETDRIKKDIIQRIRDTELLLKNCDDPAQKAELQERLETYQSLFSEF